MPDWVQFPGAEWETVSVEEAGFDARRLGAWTDAQAPEFGLGL